MNPWFIIIIVIKEIVKEIVVRLWQRVEYRCIMKSSMNVAQSALS